jgi:hypothetical protein
LNPFASARHQGLEGRMINQQSTTCARSAFFGAAIAALPALASVGSLAGSIRSRSTRCGSRLSSGSGLYAFIGTDLF